MEKRKYTSLEICTGAGGQALGLELAGFHHLALVELEKEYCDCLVVNRPEWNIICQDLRLFDGTPYNGKIDLLAGGVPCPPFSVAGKQLGQDDERDLFPQMLRLVREIGPRAVMIENVKGFLEPKFDSYRASIIYALIRMGYRPHIKLLNASDYGVPQLRPRAVIVAIRKDIIDTFDFPKPNDNPAPTVGEALFQEMASNGWENAENWKSAANSIAPTLVGGSKKHGGPDLGPTRARKAWAELGVDGRGVADAPPQEGFEGLPKLTPKMMATLQGFPENWYFGNRKTAACRMIGNAFPPPVAEAVGKEIIKTLNHGIVNPSCEKELSQTSS